MMLDQSQYIQKQINYHNVNAKFLLHAIDQDYWTFCLVHVLALVYNHDNRIGFRLPEYFSLYYNRADVRVGVFCT